MLFGVLPSLKAYDFQNYLVTLTLQVRKLPGKFAHITPLSMYIIVFLSEIYKTCVCTHIFFLWNIPFIRWYEQEGSSSPQFSLGEISQANAYRFPVNCKEDHRHASQLQICFPRQLRMALVSSNAIWTKSRICRESWKGFPLHDY